MKTTSLFFAPSFFVLSIVLCLGLAPVRAADSAPVGNTAAKLPPGSGQAWSAAEPVRRQAGTLRKTDPKAAATLLEAEIAKVSDPNVAADFFTTLGDVYTTDLKEPDKAIALFNRALPLFQTPENQVPSYHWMTMVAGKAKALSALQKGAEAESLIKENWPLLIQSSQSDNVYGIRAVSDTMQAYVAALQAQDKDAQVNDTLGQFLRFSPQYLTDPNNWMLSQLLARLQKQEKAEEALGWAKLSYQLAAFNKKDIDRATQLLNKLWAAQEEFAAVGLFVKAQTDPAANNPLAKVKTPPLSDETRQALKKRIADLEGRNLLQFNNGRARDIVKCYIMLGEPDDLREAMKAAVKLLKEQPESQDGSLMVCCVFKAADLNLLRANAFLSYMAGEGPNPIPDFLKK